LINLENLLHMKSIWIIARRELSVFFDSLMAYILIILFLTITGILTWLFGKHSIKLGGEYRQFLNNNFRQGTGSFNLPTVASFLSYALAKRAAKPGERFGQGEIKGVAAAETADNAVIPASLIPLFALGLPGSVSAAIIIAAFTVHGVTPGPRMFEEPRRLIYGIYGR
jgi:hypothetical protein